MNHDGVSSTLST